MVLVDLARLSLSCFAVSFNKALSFLVLKQEIHLTHHFKINYVPLKSPKYDLRNRQNTVNKFNEITVFDLLIFSARAARIFGGNSGILAGMNI